MTRQNDILRNLILFFIGIALTACNGTKYLAGDELLLQRNRITCDNPSVDITTLYPYILQQPNTKWFSTISVPLGIYSASGPDTTKAVNRLLRKWGEAPVAIDTSKVNASCLSILSAVQNKGFLDATVTPEQLVKGKRVKMLYHINAGEQYVIRSYSTTILDRNIDSLLHCHDVLADGPRVGQTFSINKLQDQRKRITAWLNNMGYMYFNKEAITFVVDSSQATKEVDVAMNIGLYRRSSRDSLAEHPQYYLRNVTYTFPPDNSLKLTPRTLDINTLLRRGELFSYANMQNTYNRFARLQALRSTNIYFHEPEEIVAADPTRPEYLHPIDADIQFARRRKHSIQVQPEGTNTSGDFGAALSLTYENRNVFNGAETFSLQGRGAFEAIRGLDGYDNSNYEEYGIEGKLSFPQFLIPGISRNFQRRRNATTELVVSYNRQNRPEFHRRVFTGSWRYKWQASHQRVSYQFDVIDLNYISMPWISDTFKHDYLDSVSNRNAILRYNYEDLFIMKMGFGMTYTDPLNTLRLNIETAGNLLSAIAHVFNTSRNDDGKYKIARIAFAQYVKFDGDYTRLFLMDHRNTLALHARIGFAIPYGNSDLLPFEKRYFSGGSCSVRGWNIRTLGPGNYRGQDGRISFINQSGDIRLDLNAELRTKLFWKFQGALFIDAGNVWTIRKYNDQPGGEFKLRSIYDELAVAYGAGLRLDFDYFILRLDLGMKAINPAYTTTREHFPITNHNFKRDYALHFAVGMPF